MIYEHLEDLPGLLEKKLITKRPHPSLSLSIYNYSPAAASLSISEWPEALKDCRGLILDPDGEVVGRPFRKFWNYKQVLDQIPEGPYSVWKKLDGSLGIVCNYKGFLVVATRGSFDSEQAVWAKGWLEDFMGGSFPPPAGLTYLFEIIYPENRIVVDYEGRKECQLLAVVNTETGKENWQEFYACPFPKVQQGTGPTGQESPEQLAMLDIPNEEGFVLLWNNGFRAKVKFEEYKRLHRLITQVSTRTIWEMLRAGNRLTIDAELMLRVPEQFQQWVANTVKGLETDFQTYQDQAYLCFVSRPQTNSRAEYAAWVKSQPGNFGLLFALYDNKKIDDMIWRLVEPKWATPFRREVEG